MREKDMVFSEWFDPTNYNHLKAYANVQKTGVFPEGFVPVGMDMDINWQMKLIANMACLFVEEKLAVNDSTVNCSVEHTDYQPTDEQWLCPECGANSEEGFIIDEPEPGSHSDCGLVHKNDEIHCSKCGLRGYGDDITKKLLIKAKMVMCGSCKGAGYVTGSKEHGNY